MRTGFAADCPCCTWEAERSASWTCWGSTSWQSSWWPAWMRADRPLPGASANESADPTPRLRGEQLLMIDRLELRRSRTSLERAHRARLRPGLRPFRSGSPTSSQKRSPRKRTGSPAWWRPTSTLRRTRPSLTQCRNGAGSETGRDLDRLRLRLRRTLRRQSTDRVGLSPTAYQRTVGRQPRPRPAHGLAHPPQAALLPWRAGQLAKALHVLQAARNRRTKNAQCAPRALQSEIVPLVVAGPGIMAVVGE
jgi:hypothetical protein